MATPLSAFAITGDRAEVERAKEQIAADSLLGTAGLAEDIADAVLYLAGPESRYVTGHCLVVDAGATSTTGSGRTHRLPPEPRHRRGPPQAVRPPSTVISAPLV